MLSQFYLIIYGTETGISSIYVQPEPNIVSRLLID